MPVKNGIDLLHLIRQTHPEMPVVVLTYHNDFAFVREALRLGAIDYINKTELELGTLDVTLTRIAQIANKNKETLHVFSEQKNYCQAIYLHGNITVKPPFDADCICVDENSFLFLFSSPCDEESIGEIERNLTNDTVLLFFREINTFSTGDILYQARMFMQQEYFYRKLPNLHLYEMNKKNSPPSELSAIRHIREKLFSFTWINDARLFAEILEEIPQALLPPEMVHDLFFSVQDKWFALFRSHPDMIETGAISDFSFWYQWVDWIIYLRQQLTAGIESNYSPQTTNAVRRLILFLNENFDREINAADAAAYTNLSTSYFAKCFQKITGKTFTGYLRNLRMDNARKLLAQTNLSIARIAELCGVPDAFYFTKLFKRAYGKPPSAYRQEQRIASLK